MKRRTWTLLTLLCLVSALSAFLVCASGMYIPWCYRVTSQSVNDRQVQVEVVIEASSGFTSTSFSVDYDPDVLYYDDAENPSPCVYSQAQTQSVTRTDDGTLQVSLSWDNNVQDYETTVAILLFNVTDPSGGTTDVTVSNLNTIRMGSVIDLPPETVSVVLPVHTHTAGEPVVENRNAATCAAAGWYDLVTYCTTCGEELSRERKTEPKTSDHVDADIDCICDVCGAVLSYREDFYVKYHADDHAAASSKVTTVTYGTGTTLLTPGQLGFSKAGYSFVGWKVQHEDTDMWYALSPEGSACWVVLTDGQPPAGYSFSLFPKNKTVAKLVPYGTVHVYAQWERDDGVIETLLSSNAELYPAEGTYNGSRQTAGAIVKNMLGETLTEGVDYTLTVPSGRTNVGSYTYTVTGKGQYKGSFSLTYLIIAQPLMPENLRLGASSLAYNGQQQMPVVKVITGGGKTLVNGTDYEISDGSSGKTPGTYTVTVTGKGNYIGTVSKSFKITKQPLDESRISLSWSSKSYNGAVQKPTAVVKNAAGNAMTEGNSYTVSYSYSANSKYPGKYTVTVTATGKGYYTGTVTKKLTYTIAKQSLTAGRVTLNWTSKTYNGEVQKPTVVVKSSQGGVMTEGSSYTVEYNYSANSKAPGSYSVTATVTGKGNYTGTVTKKLNYTIAAQPLAASRVSLNWTGKTYNGEVQKPTAVVKNEAGNAMTEGNSYTVSYSYSANSKYPGTYDVTVTATGKGYYTGTVTKKLTYDIAKQPLAAGRVTLNWTSKTYNGGVQKPTVVVKSSQGGVMTEGSSYTVEYSYSANSKAPGSYSVTATVTGKGSYTGTVTKKLNYTIKAQPLASGRVTLSWTSKTYNGKVQKPTVTVKNAAGSVMTEGSSYTVAFSGNCKDKGAYTVTVTGSGYYTGEVTKTFTIK